MKLDYDIAFEKFFSFKLDTDTYRQDLKNPEKCAWFLWFWDKARAEEITQNSKNLCYIIGRLAEVEEAVFKFSADEMSEIYKNKGLYQKNYVISY